MNVNVQFHGNLEKILDQAVRQGYAATKTEALRLGVLELNNRYRLLEELEDRRDAALADAVMDRIAAGKEKIRRVDVSALLRSGRQ